MAHIKWTRPSGTISSDALTHLWRMNRGEFSFDTDWEYEKYLAKLTDYYKDYKVSMFEMKKLGREKIKRYAKSMQHKRLDF